MSKANREPIPKDLLYKYFITDNLSAKEVAEIFNCSRDKIDNHLRKYNINKSPEQQAICTNRRSRMADDKRRQCWKEKTPEQWKKFKDTLSKTSTNTWNNMSKEKQQQIIQNLQQPQKNMSKEELQEMYRKNGQKHREFCKNRTSEEKLRVSEKIKLGMQNRTQEEKNLTIERFKQTWHGASEEKKLQRKQNLRNALNNRTPEEKRLSNKKHLETVRQRYGVDNIMQNEEIKQRHINTWNKKSKDEKRLIVDKGLETKRHNNTMTSSKPEEIMYKKLVQIYSLVKRQYKSKAYPYHCDFYIPQEDLYIECNFHWTHGFHKFSECEEDLKQLKEWEQKAKTSDFYRCAIKAWTISDIQKFNTAKQNNLNYLAFYNMKEFEDWVSSLTED